MTKQTPKKEEEEMDEKQKPTVTVNVHPFMGGPCPEKYGETYSAQVDYAEFMNSLREHILNRPDEFSPRENKMHYVGDEFLAQFLPAWDRSAHPLVWSKSPYIQASLGDLWLVTLFSKEEWSFYFVAEDGNLHLTAMPDVLTLDKTSGDLFGRYQLEGAFFPAFKPPWPWPILDFKKYEGLGRLNYFLETGGTNPLTILLRSPNPYKGVAAQIVAELARIRGLLIEAVGR